MNNTFDEILTQFANRDQSGYIVWGQKLLAAHNRECEQLNTEIEAMSKFNDALNAQMKELAAQCERLRSLVGELADRLHNLCCCEDGTIFDACDITDICHSAADCALVARAREMIGGVK